MTSRLLLLAITIAIGIGGLVVKQLLDSRDATWQRAQATSANLLSTVQHLVHATFVRGDAAVLHTVEHLANPEVLTLPAALRNKVLFDALLPEAYDLQLVLDAEGRVLHASRPTPSDDWSFAQAEYFVVHKENPENGLFISRPFRSFLNEGLRVALSRAYQDANGEFGGVVIVTIRLDALNRLFSSIELGPASGINLFLKNGTILMRFPHGASDVGTSLAGTTNFETFLRNGSGSFIGVAAIDAVERLYTYHTFDDLPLLVNTAQSIDSIMGRWRTNALALGAATLLLMLGSIWLALLALHELRARQRTAALLNRAQNDFRTVLDSLPALVAYWDGNLRNRFCNSAHFDWFGISREDMRDMHLREVLGDAQFMRVLPYVELTLLGEQQSFERDYEDANGVHRHTLSIYIPDITPEGVHGFFVLAMDISELKATQAALSKEKERFRVTLEAINDAVVTTDHEGRVTYQNAAAGAMTGWQTRLAFSTPIEQVVRIVHFQDRSPVTSPVRKALASRSIVAASAEYALISRSGQIIDIEASAAPILDSEGHLAGAVMVFRHIGKVRALAHEMRHRAQHDPLTQLPNRTLLHDRAQQALSRASFENGRMALLYLDLDGFKAVNDSLGHNAGDDLLVAVARRLRNALRSSDTLSRQGGDEFVVLIPEVRNIEETAVVARKLIEQCSSLFMIGGQPVNITVSIGIGIYPQDGVTLEELTRHADAAMYQAKREGRNRFVYFSDETAYNQCERVQDQGETTEPP